ncbi:hypothetical protein A9Z06_13705 [Rhizobium sp. YK2]|nr:hypothetical protein A9Z06_13705 [Rhizobium sp. YK2]
MHFDQTEAYRLVTAYIVANAAPADEFAQRIMKADDTGNRFATFRHSDVVGGKRLGTFACLLRICGDFGGIVKCSFNHSVCT